LFFRLANSNFTFDMKRISFPEIGGLLAQFP